MDLYDFSFIRDGRAERQLRMAASMLPWASSPEYELGKLYVRRGNETGRLDDYRKAKECLEHAVRMLPGQTEYEALLRQVAQRMTTP